MKPISFLASMLMLSAVIGREEGNFAEDEAKTEPAMNDTAKHVRQIETVMCGDIRIGLRNGKRWDSKPNDKETSDDNVDENLSLDKRFGENDVAYGDIPWLATMSNGIHVCGGAIISEFWVISAAYCFYGSNQNNFGVTVGDHLLWREDPNEITYNVAKIIIHEMYRPQQSDNDIALIKIKAADDGHGIRFNKYVQPISLAQATENPQVGFSLIFSGWGMITGGNRRSPVLKKAILPVVTYDSCKRLYEALTPNMFCAGYVNRGVEVCRDDRGGPAASTSGESYTLYGIVAFGNGCARPLLPAAFTSIAAYRKWIDVIIKLNEAFVCGDIKVVLTHVKRRDSRFNHMETSDDNVDENLNLDKRLGGNYVTYGEIPWQATISNGMQVCGGAIISEFWVVSAAYCFYGSNQNNFGVTVGDHLLWRGDSLEKTYNVAKIIIHQMYRSAQQSDYDIALIKIKPTGDGRGIQFNNYVQPICLPDSADSLPVGTSMIFSGWGMTTGGYRRTSVLKKAILPVVSYDSCKRLYEALRPNMFCVGYVNKGVEVCREDRGGPATFIARGSYTLYGIVAFGNGCGRPFLPAAFTSIPAYRNWIDASITLHSQGIETIMPAPSVSIT